MYLPKESFTLVPFLRVWNPWCSELTLLSAPVDEEDGEEEEKEGEAAEGGHEDDPGIWREKNGAKSQAGSRNALSHFGEELQGADSLASRLGAATPQLECPIAWGNLRHLLELLFSLSKQG